MFQACWSQYGAVVLSIVCCVGLIGGIFGVLGMAFAAHSANRDRAAAKAVQNERMDYFWESEDTWALHNKK